MFGMAQAGQERASKRELAIHSNTKGTQLVPSPHSLESGPGSRVRAESKLVGTDWEFPPYVTLLAPLPLPGMTACLSVFCWSCPLTHASGLTGRKRGRPGHARSGAQDTACRSWG